MTPLLVNELRDGDCPTCHTEILDFTLLNYEQLTKIRTWTVAQLVSFKGLAARSGVPILELLDRTSGGQGEYVGVNDFHGMFIGIEKDGYTHS